MSMAPTQPSSRRAMKSDGFRQTGTLDLADARQARFLGQLLVPSCVNYYAKCFAGREQRTAPFRPSVWRTIYDVDANHSWEISGAPFTMEPKSCRCCQESTFSTTISMVDPSQPSPLLHALAGSLGGAIAMCLLFPLERARIEFQTKSNRQREISDDEWESAEGAPASPHPTSLLGCLCQLYESNELYRGVKNNVIVLAVSNFCFFFVNEAMKKRSENKLVNSCIAGVGNVCVTNPLWVANMRIISSSRSSNLHEELLDIAGTSGIGEWWSGAAVSLLLVSNPIIQFYAYETLKGQSTTGMMTPLQAFVKGALAKLIATVLTYPLQLAQTKQRVESQKKSVIACLWSVYKTDRFSGLFTGMQAKLLQTVLTAAFTFLSYEQILRALHTVSSKTSKRRKGGS